MRFDSTKKFEFSNKSTKNSDKSCNMSQMINKRLQNHSAKFKNIANKHNDNFRRDFFVRSEFLFSIFF